MNRRAQTFCLLTLTTIASGAALYFLRPVLVPFVLAVFLTYCLTPAIDVQTRYLRMPRLLAAISALILALAVLAIFGSLVATSVGSMSQKLQDYEKQFQRLTEQFAQSVPLAGLGLGSEGEIGRFFTVQEGTGWQFISAVLGEATNLVSNGALVAIFMIFILLGRRAQQPRANGILAEIETRVKSYIVQTVFFSALTGLLVALTLAVLGVEFAWVFGLLTFLLNFVPSIGSIIATLLPLPVILLTPELSITAKVLALLIPAAIQFVIGNLVQPRVQGGALDLHPVAVLLALIFFGMIWGVSGAFLATPITAVVRIVLGRIPITRPLSDLLAGRLDVIPGEGGQPRQDAVPGDERP
jgi:AI-2 transport protein TqsA